MVTWKSLLETYKAALEDVASGKACSIEGRQITKQDIPNLMDAINYIEYKIALERNPQDALGIVNIRTN